MDSSTYKNPGFQSGELWLIQVCAEGILGAHRWAGDILVRVTVKTIELRIIWQLDSDQIKAELMQVNTYVANKLL